MTRSRTKQLFLVAPGLEPESKTKRPARRAPRDFEASEKILDFGRQHGFSDSEILEEVEGFKDHEFARPKTDWDATFRNWLRKSEQWKSKQPQKKLMCAELPESVQCRQPDESTEAYERRIADAWTSALYPNIAGQFRRGR